MNTQSREDLLDRLIAEYSDRLARGGEVDAGDLVAQVPEEHREAFERCLRMIKAGLATAPRATRALVPGTQLGNFRLVKEIGRGGMSIVFLAQQLDLKRPVALKVLRPGLAVEPQHVERFQREAMSIARLQHPHIVQVFAVGETDGWHWLAMELVEGKNLAQVYADLAQSEPDPKTWTAESLARASKIAGLAQHRSYAAALTSLLAPVARAVGVAHEIGLVHRDIKPSNILVHKDGRALIADFGLAKGDGDPGLSLTGEPIGTPYYMSPEQATLTSVRVDARTDVYSLGVTLYEGLSGRRPFEGATPLLVLDAIRSQTPRSLSSIVARIDREVESVVEQAMESVPEDRYANAFDLAHDLDALAAGSQTQAGTRRGGEWQRFRRALALSRRGHAAEYRSRTEFLGLPLVHIQFAGPEPFDARPYGKRLFGHFGLGRASTRRRRRVARGWFAVGEIAQGGLALGGMATGIVSAGGCAAGGLAFGGVAVGILPLGGFAAGVLALGGFAAGWIGIGGFAAGHYAMGGDAHGAHVISARERDPVAAEFFEANLPFVLKAWDETPRRPAH